MGTFLLPQQSRSLNCLTVRGTLRQTAIKALISIHVGKWQLQYSSKILKHLCLFPLPQCWFGYHSGLSASKYAWLNIGEGEGTFQGGKQCEVEISRFFQKIREKRCLFQRFVTSIVAWTTVTWGLIEGRLSITFKSNGKRDLYHVTKFSLCLSPTIHQISTHELVVSRNLLSIRILWAVFIGSGFFFWEIVNLNLSRMFLFSGQQS